jgi:hypothetical protein
MNEFVYVEFLFPAQHAMQLAAEVVALGNDFSLVKSELEWDSEDGNTQGYQHIHGKINAETATALTLSDSFLSKYMRVSYISDDLKDKYRKR